MPYIADGPIAGQSLTSIPGNAPWEQPPMIEDEQEALDFHLEKLEDEENMDDFLFLMAQGFPLAVFVDTVTTMGVMEGYYSLDVKTIISPLLHEYLLALAAAADIEVVEEDGITKEGRKKIKERERYLAMLEKSLANSGGESDILSETIGAMEDQAAIPAPAPSETAPPVRTPTPLISRRK